MVEDTVTSRRVRDALPVFTALASVLLALAIATTLYLAREILVPIAFAIILSFLLAPLVRLVQRPGSPAASRSSGWCSWPSGVLSPWAA